MTPNNTLQRTASIGAGDFLGSSTAAGAAPGTLPATTSTPAGRAPRKSPARSSVGRFPEALLAQMRSPTPPEAHSAGQGGLPAQMRRHQRLEALSAGRGGNTAINMATIAELGGVRRRYVNRVTNDVR
jgi:hypothetical protein